MAKPPSEAEYPYIYMDGIWLKRSWGGTVENVSILVAVGVNKEGYREMPGAAEGSREDAESWKHFCRYLKERGLRSAKLIISDKSLGILEALGDFFPEAHWQRCAVHFYRNVLSAVPASRFKKVAAMLKAIHAQEDREAARVKVRMVTEKLKQLKLEKAAALVDTGAVSAQTTLLSGSTVNSEDGRELSGIFLTASPRLCWCARDGGTSRAINGGLNAILICGRCTSRPCNNSAPAGHLEARGAPKIIRRRGILMRRSLMSGQNS